MTSFKIYTKSFHKHKKTLLPCKELKLQNYKPKIVLEYGMDSSPLIWLKEEIYTWNIVLFKVYIQFPMSHHRLPCYSE